MDEKEKEENKYYLQATESLLKLGAKYLNREDSMVLRQNGCQEFHEYVEEFVKFGQRSSPIYAWSWKEFRET